MHGEDTGDRGDAFAVLLGEVVIEEVEWDGAPKRVPLFGEEGCPYGGLRVQEGDDDVQHLVGEAADEVEARRRLFPI